MFLQFSVCQPLLKYLRNTLQSISVFFRYEVSLYLGFYETHSVTLLSTRFSYSIALILLLYVCKLTLKIHFFPKKRLTFSPLNLYLLTFSSLFILILIVCYFEVCAFLCEIVSMLSAKHYPWGQIYYYLDIHQLTTTLYSNLNKFIDEKIGKVRK